MLDLIYSNSIMVVARNNIRCQCKIAQPITPTSNRYDIMVWSHKTWLIRLVTILAETASFNLFGIKSRQFNYMVAKRNSPNIHCMDACRMEYSAGSVPVPVLPTRITRIIYGACSNFIISSDIPGPTPEPTAAEPNARARVSSSSSHSVCGGGWRP